MRYRKTSAREITSESSSIRNSKKSEIRYCPGCKGEISQVNAKYCYHCGLKLNNNENVVFYG
jgi:predicted amidophosphoribosyltransferase